MPALIRRHYLDASRAAVPSIVADYRASAGIDLEHDRADRATGTKLTMPVASLAQDWGGQLGFDPEAIWRAWAQDFSFHPIQASHFMAESHPRKAIEFVRDLMTR